eukprot:gnl/MRDRNA2_/MRDRNA2_15608_c0_seq1.p1 gnl/MRDRNA2_/MRDRNA2_15608_c0~~gnl/MRDRNA2_/MRDRNA2_15608_c0_seq1.p1  ORF type:complete len:741 (+),score=162.34 gnl/MRDRNA2_/MRDRNA2_15608_c0_seq1:166-2223(+)
MTLFNNMRTRFPKASDQAIVDCMELKCYQGGKVAKAMAMFGADEEKVGKVKLLPADDTDLQPVTLVVTSKDGPIDQSVPTVVKDWPPERLALFQRLRERFPTAPVDVIMATMSAETCQGGRCVRALKMAGHPEARLPQPGELLSEPGVAPKRGQYVRSNAARRGIPAGKCGLFLEKDMDDVLIRFGVSHVNEDKGVVPAGARDEWYPSHEVSYASEADFEKNNLVREIREKQYAQKGKDGEAGLPAAVRSCGVGPDVQEKVADPSQLGDLLEWSLKKSLANADVVPALELAEVKQELSETQKQLAATKQELEELKRKLQSKDEDLFMQVANDEARRELKETQQELDRAQEKVKALSGGLDLGEVRENLITAAWRDEMWATVEDEMRTSVERGRRQRLNQLRDKVWEVLNEFREESELVERHWGVTEDELSVQLRQARKQRLQGLRDHADRVWAAGEGIRMKSDALQSQWESWADRASRSISIGQVWVRPVSGEGVPATSDNMAGYTPSQMVRFANSATSKGAMKLLVSTRKGDIGILEMFASPTDEEADQTLKDEDVRVEDLLVDGAQALLISRFQGVATKRLRVPFLVLDFTKQQDEPEEQLRKWRDVLKLSGFKFMQPEVDEGMQNAFAVYSNKGMPIVDVNPDEAPMDDGSWIPQGGHHHKHHHHKHHHHHHKGHHHHHGAS